MFILPNYFRPQISLRACEVSDNIHALASGRGNSAAMSIVETRLCRNAFIWFGSARPNKVSKWLDFV